MAAPAQHSAEPERLYRIGDVSRLTDTKPFVLRFWETEFPMLQPVKTPKGHRLYRQEDIDLILAIKRLLYQEGFTIPGARRHLAEQLGTGAALPALVGADASAQPAASTAAQPQLQPVLFPSEQLQQPRGVHAASESAPESEQTMGLSAQQAAVLQAVRDELRAILTLLGTG
jgi:DNA-binding transcriptional MerR regulator